MKFVIILIIRVRVIRFEIYIRIRFIGIGGIWVFFFSRITTIVFIVWLDFVRFFLWLRSNFFICFFHRLGRGINFLIKILTILRTFFQDHFVVIVYSFEWIAYLSFESIAWIRFTWRIRDMGWRNRCSWVAYWRCGRCISLIIWNLLFGIDNRVFLIIR